MKSSDASGFCIIKMPHGTMPDVVSQAKISDVSLALVRVAPMEQEQPLPWLTGILELCVHTGLARRPWQHWESLR